MTTIARLAPLTAVRCVSPAVRKSSTSPAGIREVSPTTSPGSSPRSAGGSTRAARRSPARRSPAARCTSGGRPTSVGGPRTETTAATGWPARAGPSRPDSPTRWPGSRPSQRLSRARTSVGARVRTARPRTSTRSSRTSTTTRSAPRSAPRTVPGLRTGSARTTPVARHRRTVGRHLRQPAPPDGGQAQRADRAPRDQAEQHQQRGGSGPLPRRSQLRPATTAASSATDPMTIHPTDRPGGDPVATNAPAQAAAAGATSRASSASLTPSPPAAGRPASPHRCRRPRPARRPC